MHILPNNRAMQVNSGLTDILPRKCRRICEQKLYIPCGIAKNRGHPRRWLHRNRRPNRWPLFGIRLSHRIGGKPTYRRFGFGGGGVLKTPRVLKVSLNPPPRRFPLFKEGSRLFFARPVG